MDWIARAKPYARAVLVAAVLLGIVVDVGGDRVGVSRDAFVAGTLWYQPNPAAPGLRERLAALLSGAPVPDAYVHLPASEVCRKSVSEPVYAEGHDGEKFRVRALRHCKAEVLARVYAGPDGAIRSIDDTAGGSIWLQKQGFELVSLDMNDLGREVMSTNPEVFLPWFAAAALAKLAGVLAGVWRWRILLGAQGIRLGWTWLTTSYFMGRYLGIVTPGGIGLDAWCFYDTSRVTARPIACATVVAVARLTDLAAILAVGALVLPLVGLMGSDPADLARALALPIGSVVLLGFLGVWRPVAVGRLLRRVTAPRLQRALRSLIESATAYARRGDTLPAAFGCAVVAQLMTVFMYFANAIAFGIDASTSQLLCGAVLLAIGSHLGPALAIAGGRELAFVAVVGGPATAAKAFLTGSLGLWLDTFPLSLPGGYLLLRPPPAYVDVRADAAR